MWNLAPYIRNILLYESSFRSVLAKNKPYSRKNLVSENHIRGRQCTRNAHPSFSICLFSSSSAKHDEEIERNVSMATNPNGTTFYSPSLLVC